MRLTQPDEQHVVGGAPDLMERASGAEVSVDPALLERCRRIPSSTWSDALDLAGIPGVLTGLQRRAGSLPVAGPLVTVAEEVGELGSATSDQFGIELILREAHPGEVVLIHQTGRTTASAIGGLAALAARRHGVAGFLIEGACRDLDELEEVGLPILSREVTPASGRGRVRIVAVNVPLRIGSVGAMAGDLAVADETGTVIVPARRIHELLAAAEERARLDAEQADRLRRGGKPQT